jgi:branched-chain amino acid transport system substrate-binding protein
MFDRRQLLASTAALAVSGHAPLAFAADKPPIKIGSILAMTGIGSVYGVLYNAALKMAVDDVNAAGGVNGSQLTLLQEDDQLQPSQSVLCFRKLINEGAIVELGPLTGTSWETVAPIPTPPRCPPSASPPRRPAFRRRPTPFASPRLTTQRSPKAWPNSSSSIPM